MVRTKASSILKPQAQPLPQPHARIGGLGRSWEGENIENCVKYGKASVTSGGSEVHWPVLNPGCAP